MSAKKFFGTLALGALIGSAVGLFLSPATGKKNRERFKKMAKQVSENLVKEASKLSALSQKEYTAIVENVVKKYSKDDLLTKDAWLEIKDELLKRWRDVQKELKPKKIKSKKSS